VQDLVVDIPTEQGVVQAVRGLSYEVRASEVLAVVGESGSGKTVSCLAVMGLLPERAVVRGSARLGGDELLGASDAVLRRVRGNRLSMIFQDPLASLNPVYSVGHQIAEAVRVHQPVSRRAARRRAVELLELVGIPQPPLRARQYPHEFSGGMRQRVVIAMALANHPEVVFADEPTTALDVTVQAQILETLLELRDALGLAVVLVTHDLGVVAGLADRVQVMYAGRIVETGTVHDVFHRPRMPYTVGLLAAVPRGDGRQRRLSPIPGAPPSLLEPLSGCAFAPRCPLATAECILEDPRLDPLPAGSAGSPSAAPSAPTSSSRLPSPSPSPDGAVAHRVACHHHRLVADAPDPASLFRTGPAPEARW
jgi:oligopeptide/dipeptide ABC transporter ATP-binding protein